MAARYTALCSILIEGGLTPSQAKHIERELDRSRYCNLGSDGIAAVIFRWLRSRLPYIDLTPAEHNEATLWSDDKQMVFELGRGDRKD